MSTEEFLAHAEDVLTDWHGSADAATWRADGSHQGRERAVLPPRPAARELTPEQLEQVRQVEVLVRDALQRLVATTEQAVRELGGHMGRSFAELGLTLAPPPPEADPVDPRAHALAMRQARHTGPPPAPLDGRRRRR